MFSLLEEQKTCRSQKRKPKGTEIMEQRQLRSFDSQSEGERRKKRDGIKGQGRKVQELSGCVANSKLTSYFTQN